MIKLDFSNKYYTELFEIAGHKFYLTDTLLSIWVIMAVLITLAIIVRIKLKKFKAVPTGFQNVIEIVVELVDKFTIDTMGQDYRQFGAFFFGIFAFILFSNYIGLLGGIFRPPTADVSTTMVLAFLVFIAAHATGIKRQKLGYLKSFVQPNVIFLPINLIAEVSDVLSLCFRLFGNILGGVIILGLVYQMLPVLLRFVLPSALHAYFDIFSGALQAYIFTVLSMTTITQKGSPH